MGKQTICIKLSSDRLMSCGICMYTQRLQDHYSREGMWKGKAENSTIGKRERVTQLGLMMLVNRYILSSIDRLEFYFFAALSGLKGFC